MSLEVEPQEATPVGRRSVRRSFDALHHRNFALFWSGATISAIGTWMQAISVPYVIYQITDSATWVGIATAADFLPITLLAPYGGYIADRFDRRRVLVASQWILALTAFVLAAMWSAGVRSPGIILLPVIAAAIITGLDLPSWASFVNELVPRKDLMSAVALNSAGQHLGRAFGPALAGLVLATLGPFWAFTFNGLSFIVIAIIVMLVKTPERENRSESQPILGHFRDGLAYINAHVSIRLAILLAVACGLFANPILQLSIVFGEEVFEVSPKLVGILSGSIGAGAILGTLLVGVFSAHRRSQLIRVGFTVFSIGLLAFSVTGIYVFGVLQLFISGAAYLLLASGLQTTVQTQVEEHIRGRALAVYVSGFTMAYAIGALGQGWLADQIGAPQTTFVMASILLVLSAWMWLRPATSDLMDTNEVVGANEKRPRQDSNLRHTV